MNKTIKRYIRDVKKELCCPFTMKIAFISYLEKQIKDLYADTEITIETLYKEFGTPQDIANGFMDHADMPALRKKAVLYRGLLTVAIGILTITVVIISIFLIRQSCNDSTTIISNKFQK